MAELKRFEASGVDALASYLSGFEGIQSDPAYWKSRFRLWWDENPSFTPESARGWVLEVKGRIVGFLGTIPSRMMLGGREQAVRAITTWMVDAPFRNDSLAMLLELLEEAQGASVFDTTPTDHVAEVLRTLDFKSVPWGEAKEDIYAADPKALAGTVLGSFAGTVLGSVFGGFQRLRSRLKPSSALRVDAVEAIAGEDYDALWEKTKDLYDATNVRDAAAVRWSALADRVVRKRFLECRDAGKLRGYLVLKPRTRRGLETFECADLWVDPEHPEALDALIARAACEPPLVSFPHFTPQLGKRLGRYGMVEVPTRPRKNLWLPARGAAPERPYFCLLQGDYGTAP